MTFNQENCINYFKESSDSYKDQQHRSHKEAKLDELTREANKKVMGLAAGWYIAMPSKELGKKPKAIELFGFPLVAWRDKQDHPVIMQRYCSHLGASLAIGELKDGCIQCPFHHWRYDTSGQCISVPDVNHIPPRARQATYTTTERYGYVWAWYGTTSPLFSLPEFPPAEDDKDNYMSWRLKLDTSTTARQVLENMYDYYHLVAVHGMRLAGSIKFTLLDPTQELKLPIQRDAWFGALIDARIEGYNGLIGVIAQSLGLKADTFTSRLDSCPSVNLVSGFVNGEERFRVLDAMTPVSATKTIWHALLMINKSGKLWLDTLNYFALGLQSKVSAVQDVKIFNTLNPERGGAYVMHDQSILKYRDFYQIWENKVNVV